MSRDYLINNPPPKPTLDPNSIKEVLVTATALASSVKPILDKPDTSEDMKSVVTMLMVMLSVMEAVIEKGIEPFSAVVTSAAMSGKGSRNENGKSAPPAIAVKPSLPGRNELIDALNKSELESVIFGANLGSKPILNRTILNNNFSADLDRKTKERANKDKADVQESVRLVEDALSRVEKIEFLGGRSKNYVNNRDSQDPLNNTYTTMPVKVSFSDKESRWNEMMVFRKALLDRYPGWLIRIRYLLNSLVLRKKTVTPDGTRFLRPTPSL
jgi:hypothetical protein